MNISKIIILSFILIILSVSCVNASDLEENVQNNDVADLEIDEYINQDSNYLNHNFDDNLNDNLNVDLAPNDDVGNDLNNNLESNDDADLLHELSNDGNSNNKNTLRDDSTTVHQVSPTTYSRYFNKNGYVITDVVSPGDTIDLSGRFSKKNFIFTIPCSITSSQSNAYLTNCMVEFENVTSTQSLPSSVSNLKFNTSIEKSPCVYVLGSSYVEVYNCNAYSTGANSNPTLLVGSNYCSIHDNVFETTFTGHMNLSWKRAGILLGESHYNNIYSNFVTVKDSNGIYLTTYGYEKSNYNIIFNNTISTSAFSNETGLRNPSAWAYGVHIMGDYNSALNNTIMNTYRGVDSEGSFNQIIGNRIFNLSGSYYEGNNGTDGGEGGIYASYNNLIANNTIYDSKITGVAIFAVENTTVYGNTIENITGPNGIQFALAASNCLIHNNTINMASGNAILVKGNMTNVTLSNNVLSSKNGTGILVLKQTRSKYPIDVTIVDNLFLENLNDCIDYSDVEGKTIVNLENNTAFVTSQNFFNFFSSNGTLFSSNPFETLIFKGEFINLLDSDASGDNGLINDEIVKAIDLDGRISIIGENAIIRDISFNINSDCVKLDNILVNITDASSNAFNFNNVNDCRLTNSIIYFNSTAGQGEASPNERFIPISANNSRITLSNNTIIVYSENSLLVLNNSNCSLSDNILNSSSLNSPVILNDNGSCLSFGENEIHSSVDPSIVSINGAIIKYVYFIIDDYNYHEYFNLDGSFLEDVIFNFGDVIRIGNVNNKVFRFDIPLIIIGQKGSIMNNSLIILEGESSNSVVTNFTFQLADCECVEDVSIVTIKDGVSNLVISNNKFNISNLTGDHVSLSIIKLNPSDVVSSNILIENNDIVVDSNLSQINGISIRKEGMGLNNQVEDIRIINNSISIVNIKSDGTSNGINVESSLNSLIFNNSIYIKSSTANGILIEKSDFAIRNNSIMVDGSNYEKVLEHIGDNSLRDLLEDGQIKADCAISIDKNTVLNDDVTFENILIENNAIINLIHLSNSLRDLENIIKNAPDGSVIDLGNNVYVVQDSIDIYKSIYLKNGIVISNLKGGNVLFDVLANADSGDKSFNISNSTIVLDNSNIFMIVNSLEDNNPKAIHVPFINIKENDFKALSDDVVSESITILRLVSYNKILSTDNNISIEGNRIESGMKVFKFDVKAIENGSDIFISNDGFSPAVPSRIIYKDMVTTAVDTITDGRVGQYFNVSLTDDKGNPLANKLVQIGFNGVIYNRTTDDKGACRLQINLPGEGFYTFAISFLGDDEYEASFAVAKVTVKKQKPVISCTNYYYKASAKSKKISISLKSASRKALKNKTVKLVLNGKTYSGKTNSKGVVTINVSISKKKTYSFTVKYAGDKTYSAVSKTAKLIIS